MLHLEDLVEATQSIELEFSDISEKQELSQSDKYKDNIFYFSQDGTNTYKLYRDEANNESTPNTIQKHIFKVELKQANSELDLLLSNGSITLAQVKNCDKKRVQLFVISFPFGTEPMGELTIGLTKKNLKKARKVGIAVESLEDLSKNLADKINFNVGKDEFFVFKKKEAAAKDFEDEDEETLNKKTFKGKKDKIKEDSNQEDNEESHTYYYKQKNLISIYGRGLSIPVKLYMNKNDITDRRLEVCNISTRNKEKTFIHLAKGKILFREGNLTGKLTNEQRNKLEILTVEGNTYLSKWEEFCNIETEILIDNAIHFGELKYKSYEKTPNGYRFYLDKDNIKKTSSGCELVQFDKAPDFYNLARNIDSPTKLLSSITKLYRGLVSHKIRQSNPKYIELDYNDEDPQPYGEGYLCLSISGDIHQKTRQISARNRIAQGKAANPHLRELLEPVDYTSPKQTGRKIAPLSDYVKNKIFKNPPTETQIKAIDIALNTPDIALIQGPPGTGKTSVITAIIERLCEEYDKTKEIKGNILVSSFQQDAVENVVSRLDFFSAIKLGKRNSENDTESYGYKRIEKWIEDITRKIRTQNPKLKENDDVVALNELCSNYYINPSIENCKAIFECIDALPYSTISSSLRQECKELFVKLFKKQLQFERDETDELLEQVNRIRTNKLSFTDDGPKNCYTLCELLKNSSLISKNEIEVLKKASEWNKTLPLDFLSELAQIKEILLDTLIEPPSVFSNKPNSEVIAICEKISRELLKKNKDSNSEEQILADLLFDFQSNPIAIKKAISQYCCIYAATTQQSVSNEVIALKLENNESKDSSDLSYDTVIIDEAARASPADLLIPMTQAKRRIILVGDHKQLPHMIDQELEKRVIENNDDSLDYLNKSLFEYLKNRLQKLTANDGIQRTITLDAQYRTHPILGNFISENFYEIDGEGFRSPLGKQYFKQNLQRIEDKPAVWINIPYRSDRDMTRTPARSYEREYEAELIAKTIKVWIDSEEGENLSFGIISFYSGQVEAIKEALCSPNISIMKKTKNGFDICEEYRYLKDGTTERLRVGSVDAFQGKEFDVIILSMVRTLPKDKIEEFYLQALNKSPEATGRKVFGFMTFMNRLNVSMSRQKKVLVVFGDADLASSKLAEICVKPLYNFFYLCGKEGVIFHAK